MSRTTIAWTARPGTIPETWNPTTGCTRESEGCRNCYALRRAARNKAMGLRAYQNHGDTTLGKFGPMSGPGFKLTLHQDRLATPLHWREPRTVFVDSMSDLFHPDVPLDFIRLVFDVMERCPRHTFQVLTKQATRLTRLAGDLPWPRNVWMGVSVEDQKQVRRRAARLLTVPAAVRFLSVEPLLEQVDLGGLLDYGWCPRNGFDWHDCAVCRGGDHWRFHWVIAGGESGPACRHCDLEWLRLLMDDCQSAGVAFFVKQLGEQWARRNHAKDRKGEDPSEWPIDLRRRQWPDLDPGQACRPGRRHRVGSPSRVDRFIAHQEKP